MNPLQDVLTPALRKYLYAAYAVAGLVLGALTIAGVGTGKTSDVLAYLGAALGLTAASNVKAAKKNQKGAADVGLILLVLTFVGVVLLLFKVRLGG